MSATVITITNDMIQIVPASGGIEVFDITTYFPNGIRLAGIGFTGTAASDVLKVRNRAATGAFITNPALGGTGDAITFDPPMDCFPYILDTDCTLGTPASAIITLYYC